MPFNQTICASCRRALQIGSRHSSFTGLKPALQTRRALSTATRSSDISPQQCRTFPRPQIPKTYRNANRINYARPFSSSKTIQKVILNPRQDEDGVEMSLSITPRASNRLKQIAEKDSEPQVLRITVESGGCHGFQYLMSLSSPEKINNEEDTVIEADDGTGAQIVLDEPSLELLKGSKVDYSMELIGSQFKIVDNPAATSACGCGTSFDVKAF